MFDFLESLMHLHPINTCKLGYNSENEREVSYLTQVHHLLGKKKATETMKKESDIVAIFFIVFKKRLALSQAHTKHTKD